MMISWERQAGAKLALRGGEETTCLGAVTPSQFLHPVLRLRSSSLLPWDPPSA
jgi:hypothetical protein